MGSIKYVEIKKYVTINFYLRFCFNFISIHYHTPKQKLPKRKINYDKYINFNLQGWFREILSIHFFFHFDAMKFDENLNFFYLFIFLKK